MTKEEQLLARGQTNAVVETVLHKPGNLFLQAYQLWGRFRRKAFTSFCRSGFFQIDKGSVIVPPLRVEGEQFISLGRNVYLGSNSWLQVVRNPHSASNPALLIGDETSIAGSVTITAAESVIIEADVLMAQNVYISDHSHAHESRLTPIKDQGISKIAPVRICEGAWLGQGVVVCPGVTIGRNAVIGANSVVRHDVPDFCVAAGAPARVLRKIDETRSSDRSLASFQTEERDVLTHKL